MCVYTGVVKCCVVDVMRCLVVVDGAHVDGGDGVPIPLTHTKHTHMNTPTPLYTPTSYSTTA